MVRTKSKNVRLVTAMAERCLTGRDLARGVRVHPNTVSALINQRRDPTPKTAEAIAEVLGLTPEEIGFDLRALP